MKIWKYDRVLCRLAFLTLSVMALFSGEIVEFSCATEADVAPPQLQSLSISPTYVDVSTQSQTIVVTARITDNLSGVHFGVITITSPSGRQARAANAVLSSGNSLDGIWTFSITIPKSSESGTWKVTQILLQDSASPANSSSFTEEQGIQVTGTADTTPPHLQSLSISPTTVDVSSQSQTINVTARITDNLSGVHWGVIEMTSPSGKQTRTANAVLSAGDSYDGIWTFAISMLKFSETGTWKVTRIGLQDSAQNESDLFEFTEEYKIQVTGTADITPPQLESLSVSPTTVDVSKQSQTINFTARITDSLSGVHWGVIEMTSPSGKQTSAANAVLSSGDIHDGIWTFAVKIDTLSEPGTWKVTRILLQDGVGNSASFTNEQEIQVTAQPLLRSLSIAPMSVDVGTQPQTVTFTAHITDNLADFTWGVITLTSPSGKQTSSANAVFASGTSRDGAWNFPIIIPKSSEPGTWKVTQIRLQDKAGNDSSFSDTRTITVVPQPGDVNFSGTVDIKDAILSMQVLSRMTPAETVHKEVDVNGDKQIGMAEVIYILQKVAGIR